MPQRQIKNAANKNENCYKYKLLAANTKYLVQKQFTCSKSNNHTENTDKLLERHKLLQIQKKVAATTEIVFLHIQKDRVRPYEHGYK